GQSLALEEAVQYSEAASLLNQFASADISALGRKYWSKQKVDTHLKSQLPYRPLASEEKEPKHSNVYSSLAFHLPSSVLNKLDQICEQWQVRRESYLLGCLEIVFLRLGGWPACLVGITFDGRTDGALYNAVGPYEKSLPFVSHLNQEMSLEA